MECVMPKVTQPPLQQIDPAQAKALANLKDLFKRHYYFSDDSMIDVVLGVYAGNHFDTDPAWLYLIGPPSSGKTELLFSLFTCPDVFFLSDLTGATLISGYREERGEGQVEDKDFSLLPQLNGKLVVTKDFSIIHDKPQETRNQVYAILRDVYDGYASRGFGNAVTKGFHSKFNYLAGMTPDIERSWSISTLGERFLMYRISIDDRRAHCRAALMDARSRELGGTSARAEIQTAVKQFLELTSREQPRVSDAMIEQITDLADFLSICRTYVHRDHTEEILYKPHAELGPRVGKQLMRIGQGVALVRGAKSVGQPEIAIMKRIALDSLPVNRLRLLTILWDNRDAPTPLETFNAGMTGVSATVVKRQLENLAELGAVVRVKQQVSVSGGKTKLDGMLKTTSTAKVLYRMAEPLLDGCLRVGGISP